jgi:hypothetical protein
MKNNERGQALIELIVFLPLMITLYSVIAGFASSINGSINQQKVTRSYFYYRIQNNSNIPGPKSGAFDTWKQFGMFYIGWKERFEGDDQPVMPCYKVSIPFKNEPTDECGEKYEVEQTTWVRVGTIYGYCGATYINENQVISMLPDSTGDYNVLSDLSSCTITQ